MIKRFICSLFGHSLEAKFYFKKFKLYIHCTRCNIYYDYDHNEVNMDDK